MDFVYHFGVKVSSLACHLRMFCKPSYHFLIFSRFESFRSLKSQCSLNNTASIYSAPLSYLRTVITLFVCTQCACICVYLLSDLCNSCFNSVSSSSGAVTIHFLHIFPLTLSFSPSLSFSFSLRLYRRLGQLCIYSSVCSFMPFICISLTHTSAHTAVQLSAADISQSIREQERENETVHIFCDKREELFFTGRSICLSWLALFLSQSDICISSTLLHSNAFITLTDTWPSHSLNEAHSLTSLFYTFINITSESHCSFYAIFTAMTKTKHLYCQSTFSIAAIKEKWCKIFNTKA